MRQSSWIVDFYEKENGSCPTQEFLDEIKSKKEIIYIERAFERLENYGYELKRPHVAPLRDHIYELRVRTNHNLYRFLFFYYKNQIIIVTHGIIKKSDKVPDPEIDKAIEYMKDYLTKNK